MLADEVREEAMPDSRRGQSSNKKPDATARNLTGAINAMIEQAGAFAVSILAKGQENASAYFARTGRMPTPDFVEIEGEYTKSGQPVVKGALAYLVCSLHHTIAQGDHTIVIGAVLEAASRDDGEPLVYWRRGYRGLMTGPG